MSNKRTKHSSEFKAKVVPCASASLTSGWSGEGGTVLIQVIAPPPSA